MSTQITDLIKETVSKIQQYETRERARSAKAQQSLEYAVTAILVDLWKASFTVPASECLINKRNGYYSENRRYKHPLMTYKQTEAAFKGLLMLGYIEVTKEGYFGRPPISFFPTFAVDFRCKLLKYRGLMSKLCRTSTISSIFLLLRVLNLLGPSTTLVNMSDFYTQLYYGP